MAKVYLAVVDEWDNFQGFVSGEDGNDCVSKLEGSGFRGYGCLLYWKVSSDPLYTNPNGKRKGDFIG